MQYYPEPIPNDPKDIPHYIHRELLRLADYLSQIEPDYLQLLVNQTTLPKPRQGLIAYSAAGILGQSEGLYRYNGSSWVYIG